MGATIELAGGHAGGESDLGAVSETVPGVGRAPEEPPPALDQVEPTGGDRDKDLVDARVGGEPVVDGSTGVATQIVRNQVQVALRVVAVKRAQQIQIADGITRGSGLGEDVPVARAERSIHPRLVVPAAVDERRLDAMAIG